MKRRIWLLPGPVDVPHSRLKLRGTSIESGHGQNWYSEYRDLISRIRSLIGLRGSVILLPGNAHLGIEIALRNLTPPGAKVLVVENGFWGRRLAEIAEFCGYQVTRQSFPESEPISTDRVADTLKAAHYDTLALVHGESSTGILNELDPIAQLCSDLDVSLIVDAVATLAVVPLRASAIARCIVVASVVKGIGSEPGLVVILLSPSADKYTDDRVHCVGYFSDLRLWSNAVKEPTGEVPTLGSVSVSHFRVLEGAITEIEREGVKARLLRHHKAAAYTRANLLTMQFSPINESSPLPTITAAAVPPSLNAFDVVQSLSEQGIYIDTGIGAEAGDIIRVGHMSETASVAVMNEFFVGLRVVMEEFLRK